MGDGTSKTNLKCGPLDVTYPMDHDPRVDLWPSYVTCSRPGDEIVMSGCPSGTRKWICIVDSSRG